MDVSEVVFDTKLPDSISNLNIQKTMTSNWLNLQSNDGDQSFIPTEMSSSSQTPNLMKEYMHIETVNSQMLAEMC